MKLKVKDIQKLRQLLIIKQGHTCYLCGIPFGEGFVACLDHDHRTGHVRAVLCQNCNGIEGKIYNLSRRASRKSTPKEFLQRVLGYWNVENWENHSGSVEPIIHPAFKTKDEKRILRNKRARIKRKKQFDILED